MAAKPKNSVIYAEKFKKNTPIPLDDVLNIISKYKDKTTSDVLEKGRMSDGSEFMVIKLIIQE